MGFSTHRFAWRMALGTGLLVALLGSIYLKWELVDYRLVEIAPDRVYQSAAIPADQIVGVVRYYGIRTVIDLRDVDLELVAAEHAALANAGFVHVHLPTLLDPTVDSAQAFLSAVREAEKPVLVHCKHGQGRSVTMAAVYRIVEEGWENEAAFQGTARLPDSLRFLTAIWPWLQRFRRDSSKGEFVLGYQRTS